MRVLKVKVILLQYIFQVLYVLCFTRPRYQVSVYRTIGPPVIKEVSNFGSIDENLLSFRYLTQNGTELSLKGKTFAHKIVP